jgi:predicted CXXCH cytochrome family protein
MTFNRIQLIFFVLFLILLGTGGSALAQKVCFQCHDKALFNKRIIHKPLAEGKCISCHNPHAARHEGLLQENLKDLCLSCHKNVLDIKNKDVVVHEPVQKGECTRCHDPHSSNYKGLMRGKLVETCLECHGTVKKKYKNTHKPYAEGKCEACHSLHWADNYQLLTSSPGAICQKCHSGSEISNAHTGYPVKVNECLSCHNPHGSGLKAMVRDFLHPPFAEGCSDCHQGGGRQVDHEICLNCHEEIAKDLQTIHSHLTENKGNGCTNCHSPHAGDTKKLLKGRQTSVCRECHSDTFKKHGESLFVHKATVNECNKCHAIHGNNHVVLLKSDGNLICLACHPDQGQFSHPVGEDVKDPRNRQMTTCVTCHDPHGTNFKGGLKLSGQEDLCVQCHKM